MRPAARPSSSKATAAGMYTIQSLWTQAREQLDVVNVVFANDIYRILQIELQRAGIERPGPQGLASPSSPLRRRLVGGREGFGVPWSRAETAEALPASSPAPSPSPVRR